MTNKEPLPDIFPDLFETIKINLRDGLIDYLDQNPETITEVNSFSNNLPDWTDLDTSLVDDIIPQDLKSIASLAHYHGLRLDSKDIDDLQMEVEDFFYGQINAWWENEVGEWFEEVVDCFQDESRQIAVDTVHRNKTDFPIKTDN